MNYEDISETMRHFIAGREAFRKLGFQAADLFCVVAMSVKTLTLSAFVLLRTQGKEFSFELGSVESEESFAAEYLKVTVAINNGLVSESDFNRMKAESEAFTDSLGFINAIMSKGIRIPGAESS